MKINGKIIIKLNFNNVCRDLMAGFSQCSRPGLEMAVFKAKFFEIKNFSFEIKNFGFGFKAGRGRAGTRNRNGRLRNGPCYVHF